MAALYRRNPALAERIDRLPFAEAPELSATPEGAPTAQVRADDGRPILLHSQRQPLAEARRLAETLDPDEASAVLLCGVGLGHVLPALEARLRRPLLIVAEPDPALMKAALCLHDLRAPIEQGRLVVLSEARKDLLHDALAPWTADLLLGTRILTPPHARRRGSGFFADVQRLLTEFLAFGRMQMVTLLKVARITFRNVSGNLAAYLRNPGVETLRDRAAGYPAIIVAAGPSLAREIEGVLALRNRAVIIGVQTVLRLMHDLGCPPHFVTSLDYHEVSAGFFEGLGDVGDCVLVAEPKAPAKVLDLYPGRRIVLHNPLYQRLLREAAPRHEGLKAGSTVAHLAFYLAQHLGCDPILLVGQDLCFSEGLFYPPGTAVERIWQPELGRFQTVEMKHWERIVRNRNILRRVTDAAGRSTYSDELMLHYAEQFQADFARCAARVIQIGPSGLPLAGATRLSLADAAAQYCTRRLPEDLLRLPPERAPDAAQVRAALRARLDDVERVREIAARMRDCLAELWELTERPAEFNRRLVEVDALRERMLEHDDTYGLVLEVSQAAELRRYSADRRLGESEFETQATVRQRLKRDREFVESFLDGCEFLRRTLPDVLGRAEEQLA